MNFRQTKNFTRDCKRLKKKYKSLDRDLDKLKMVLRKFPAGLPSKNWAILKKYRQILIIKTRLSCASLKNRSLRVIYAYHQNTKTIEMICFIEIFAKNVKEREDQTNIKKYLKSCQQ
jgi:hypothetical protein